MLTKRSWCRAGADRGSAEGFCAAGEGTGMNDMSEVTTAGSTQVARPLRVLVPLIKDDLANIEQAGMPYRRAAGEKMLEAKTSGAMSHSELLAWIKRTFDLGRTQGAYVYVVC